MESPPPANATQNQPELAPSKNLWIGNIGLDVNEPELFKLFRIFGEITSVRILHHKYCAFVNFQKEDDAQTAKEQLQNTTLKGQPLTINFQSPTPARPSSRSSAENILPNIGYPILPSFVPYEESPNFTEPARALWIGNLAESVDQKTLCEKFETYGEVESVRILRQKACAFVNFKAKDDAVKALNGLQGTKLGEFAIKINYAKDPADRKKTKLPNYPVPPYPVTTVAFVSPAPFYSPPFYGYTQPSPHPFSFKG